MPLKYQGKTVNIQTPQNMYRDNAEFNRSADILIINWGLISYEMRILLALSRCKCVCVCLHFFGAHLLLELILIFKSIAAPYPLYHKTFYSSNCLIGLCWTTTNAGRTDYSLPMCQFRCNPVCVTKEKWMFKIDTFSSKTRKKKSFVYTVGRSTVRIR